jgi:hypothetical protein
MLLIGLLFVGALILGAALEVIATVSGWFSRS